MGAEMLSQDRVIWFANFVVLKQILVNIPHRKAEWKIVDATLS